MNDTSTTTPRPKAKKNKIRPKLKPIVSTHEDDDDGVLGYGEWAPSPLKTRQTPENNWSGSEEDEKKEDDAIDEIKKTSPKLQPVSTTKREVTKEEEVKSEARLDEVATYRPTQGQRCFDNKLQLSEINTDGEVEKVSNTRTSSTNTYTQQVEVSDIENILSDGNLQILRSRIWKGFILILCIAISCEVLSIAIITKVRLSHVELSSDENEAWVPDKEPTIEETGVDEVLTTSREEKDQLPNMERVEVEEEKGYVDAAEPAIYSISESAIVNEEQNDGGSAIEVQDNELMKLNEEATGGDEQPFIDFSSSESSENNDEQTTTQKVEESDSIMIEQESDFGLKSEENFSISEEVTVSDVQMMPVTIHLDANSTLNLSGDEVSGDELDANEQAEEDLPVDATAEVREDFESNDEQSSAIHDEVLPMHEALESAMNELPEPEENLPSVEEEEELESMERNDDEPNTQEDEGPESVSRELPEAERAEEHLSPPEEVLISETCEQNVSLVTEEELDANSTVDSSGNDGLGDELDEHEQADTDLVEITIHDFDKHGQPELVVSDEHERDSLCVKEAAAEGKQPATNIHDAGNATMPSSDVAESVENEHTQIELIEKDRITENGNDQSKPEGSPSFDDNTHGDNDQEEKEDVHQQVVLPRTVEIKREYLASLQKFEDIFEPHEVIDALIGHVVCVVPRLLLKGIFGVAMKIKRRFSKKQ